MSLFASAYFGKVESFEIEEKQWIKKNKISATCIFSTVQFHALILILNKFSMSVYFKGLEWKMKMQTKDTKTQRNRIYPSI